MEHPFPPQMRINMPLITSELFFSSGGGGAPLSQTETLTDTPSDENTQCPLPIGSGNNCKHDADFVEEEDADGDLFVDLSRELAAIEGSEPLPSAQSVSVNDKRVKNSFAFSPQSDKFHTIMGVEEAPARVDTALGAANESTWASYSRQGDPLSASWNFQQEKRLDDVSPRARKKGTRLRFYGVSKPSTSPSVLHESLGDVPTEGSNGMWKPESGEAPAEECESHTDSDLASLLGSIEQTRRRIRAHEESENRFDAAMYAGGLSHFARSAAASACLLQRATGQETRKHVNCSSRTNGAKAETVKDNAVNGDAANGNAGVPGEATAVSGSVTYSCDAADVKHQQHQVQQGWEARRDPEQCGRDSKSSELVANKREQSKNDMVIRKEGADVADEMKRSALLSAALADLKEELKISQEELTKTRVMAHLSSRVIFKLREWRDTRGTTSENNESQISAAEKCLNELEDLLHRGQEEGQIHASEIEELQIELINTKEAKRAAELQVETLRNEIAFLQLVNGKIAEKKAEEHNSALEALKQHLDKKTQEVKIALEEKETLRRELDHLKTHWAEQLAAADAARATLQHELDAQNHIADLKKQEFEEAAERLRNENQQLRQQKEAAEGRLRQSAQAERLAQLEREKMQEKQAKLSAQHEALRKSLQEIRSSAAAARRKWLEGGTSPEKNENPPPDDREWDPSGAAREKEWEPPEKAPGHTTVSVSSVSPVEEVQQESKGSPASPEKQQRAFQSSRHYGQALPESAFYSERLKKSDTNNIKSANNASNINSGWTEQMRVGEVVERGTSEGSKVNQQGGHAGQENEAKEAHSINMVSSYFITQGKHLSTKPVVMEKPSVAPVTPELTLGRYRPATQSAAECADSPSKTEVKTTNDERVKEVKPFATGGYGATAAAAAAKGGAHLGPGACLQEGPKSLVNQHPVGAHCKDTPWGPSQGAHIVLSCPALSVLNDPTAALTNGSPDSALSDGIGLGNANKAVKCSDLFSPQFDASSAKLGEVAYDIPSSVSAEINEATASCEIEPGSGSAMCLFTEKLQEVEEANEMLRRTNALVDKENAFLKQTLQGLLASPCVNKLGSLSPPKALPLPEAFSPIDLSSPSHGGDETARSPLALDPSQSISAENTNTDIRHRTSTLRLLQNNTRIAETTRKPFEVSVHLGVQVELSAVAAVLNGLEPLGQVTAKSVGEKLGFSRLLHGPPETTGAMVRSSSCPVVCPKRSIRENQRSTKCEEVDDRPIEAVLFSPNKKRKTACVPLRYETQQALTTALPASKESACAQSAVSSVWLETKEHEKAADVQEEVLEAFSPRPSSPVGIEKKEMKPGGGVMSSSCFWLLHPTDCNGGASPSASVADESHLEANQIETNNEGAVADSQGGDIEEAPPSPRVDNKSTQTSAEVHSDSTAKNASGSSNEQAEKKNNNNNNDTKVEGVASACGDTEEQKIKNISVVVRDAPSPVSERKTVERSRLLSVETRAPTPRVAGMREILKELRESTANSEVNESGVEEETKNTASGVKDTVIGNSQESIQDKRIIKNKQKDGEGIHPPSETEGERDADTHDSNCETSKDREAAPAARASPALPSDNNREAPPDSPTNQIGESAPMVSPARKGAPRCSRTACESTAMASARRLVAEAGQSFKLKFLQHTKAALLREVPEDRDDLDSLLLTPNIDGSILSPSTQKPSSRRCEACMAVACDRLLGESIESPTAAAALRMLVPPARRELTHALQTLKSPKKYLGKKQKNAERKEKAIVAVSSWGDLRAERDLLASADARDLIWLLSRHLPKSSSLGVATHKVGIASSEKATKLRSNSESRAMQILHEARKTPSRFAGPSPTRQMGRPKPTSSPFRSASATKLTPSLSRVAHRPAPVQPKCQKSKMRSKPENEGVQILVADAKDQQAGSAVAARGGPSTDQRCINTAEGVAERQMTPMVIRSKSVVVLGEKSTHFTKTEGATLRPMSPVVQQDKARPTSAPRGRYPGERPPWDFSSAPMQGGPRVPFKNLMRKIKVAGRERG